MSTFNHEKQVYILAVEIKSSLDQATSQNLDQMLGLWRAKQVFMLGWTINPTHIHCGQEGIGMTVYVLQMPNDNQSILYLSKLYLASFLIVKASN